MGLLSPCATAREVQSLQQRAHVRHEDPLQPSTYIQTSQACSSKESTCQCRRCEFDPWVGKILWSRKWQSTPMDRGAWIKGLTTENAYLLMSFGFVISLRVSGCLKWLRTPTWHFCEKSIDKWMTNLEQAKDIFQVQLLIGMCLSLIFAYIIIIITPMSLWKRKTTLTTSHSSEEILDHLHHWFKTFWVRVFQNEVYVSVLEMRMLI